MNAAHKTTRRPDIHQELMLVTPELANTWLKQNIINRIISERDVDKFVRIIKNGKWEITHQGVAFYDDGTFADGQHRLLAVVKSRVPVQMFVAFNIPKRALTAIDQHRMRKTEAVIQMSGEAPWLGKDQIAVLRILVMFAALSSGQGRSSFVLSADEIIEKANMVKDRLQFASLITKGQKIKGLTGAPLGAAIALAYGIEDEYRLLEFIDVIKSGLAHGPDDVAAIKLRDWSLSENATLGGDAMRKGYTRKAQRAIKAFCKREQIKKLVEPSYLIYPSPPELAVIQQKPTLSVV